MVLTLEDARRPLISENAELWNSFEPALPRKLAEKMAHATVTERLRNALLEAIPSGDTTSDQLADRLYMSNRSLQRHLKQIRNKLSAGARRSPNRVVPTLSYEHRFEHRRSFFSAWIREFNIFFSSLSELVRYDALRVQVFAMTLRSAP